MLCILQGQRVLLHANAPRMVLLLAFVAVDIGFVLS
jgi:hypothetical protein